MDKTKGLLLAVCVGLAGVVVWQQSADVAIVAPKPLQLMKSPDTAASTPVAPALGSVAAAPATVNANATVAPAANPSKAAPSRPAPRRDAKPMAAAPANAPHATAVVPAPAPAAPVASAPAPIPEKAGDADAYAVQAVAKLQQGDYRQAGELFEAALRNGGQARFAIVHDHSKGNFEKDPKASCVGELILTPTEIKFDGAGAADSHHFEASWAEVLEAGSNRFFGSGLGGFHVAINPEGKYKNFNLAPRSKDKDEAKLIVDLLSSNKQAKQKTDRGK